MTPLDEYLTVVDLACDALDGVEEYGIQEGDAGLLVMHGLAMHVRDTARAAALLLRDSRTIPAAALVRIVIEHAVLAQWLKADPERRGQLFLEQGWVERARWFEVFLDAHFDPKDPLYAAMTEREKRDGLASRPRNVDEVFHTPKNLFGDGENGRMLYLTYRNLSRFVHPSITTFLRYTEDPPLGGGVQLFPDLRQDQDPESVAFYLATSAVMCAQPYLELLGENETDVSLLVAARAAHVPAALD